MLVVLAVWAGALVAGRQPAEAQSAGAAAGNVVRTPAARQLVTFTEHVAPIVIRSCASCHRPAGVAGGPGRALDPADPICVTGAPFPLLTYDDVRSRAPQIVAAVSSRRMPPWTLEPGHGEFINERRLTDAQIATFRQWLADGTPRGDPARMPPLPTWSGDWQRGRPDLILEIPAYTLRATGDDMYRNFVLPIDVAGTRYVKAWEFLPGTTRAVHHATMQMDVRGSARRLDSEDPAPGYEGLIPRSVQSPDGFFLDWGPGHAPYEAPEGMAWPLQPKSDLVMMLHLRPTGKPETVRVRLGLFFSDRPPTRVPTLVRLTRQGLDIPAGTRRYEVRDSFTLNADVEVQSVQPHAHLLAREIVGVATLPDGSERRLIAIRNWDFDWQGVFRYAKPVSLPAGTTIHMQVVYDNSAGNARNPNTPPRRVTYGQRTTDEMAELWFQVVTKNAADRPALGRALQAHVLREEIVGHEKMLESDPTNVSLHNGVALIYAEVGDLQGASRHFLETVRLEPAAPQAHYNAGMALLLQGQRRDAEPYLAKAIALSPEYALAHDGLGMVQQGEGNLDAAIASFAQAVRLAPDRPVPRHHLASALRARGRSAEAATEFRELLRIDPGRAGVREELAEVERALR